MSASNRNMTAHVVVVSQGDQIVDVWADNEYGLLSREHAEKLAEWGNDQPGDSLHQAVAVTVPASAPTGRSK